MLTKSHPEAAKKLLELAKEDVRQKWHHYKQLAGLNYSDEETAGK